MIRNGHGINLPTGVGLMFVFKAQQLAHSWLRNYCCNQEDGHKDKRVAKLFRARTLARVFVFGPVFPEIAGHRFCLFLTVNFT